MLDTIMNIADTNILIAPPCNLKSDCLAAFNGSNLTSVNMVTDGFPSNLVASYTGHYSFSICTSYPRIFHLVTRATKTLDTLSNAMVISILFFDIFNAVWNIILFEVFFDLVYSIPTVTVSDYNLMLLPAPFG